MKKIIALAISLMMLQGVHAAVQTLPFTDHFDYNEGTLSTVAPGIWDVGSNNGVEISVSSSAALTSPSGFAASSGKGVNWSSSGTARRSVVQYSSVPAADGATVYASFLLNVLSASTANKIAYLDDHSTSQGSPQLGIFAGSGSIGIGKKSSAPGFSTALSSGTHLIVVRYTFQAGNDRVDLWVDPSSSDYGAASAPASLGSTTGSSDPTSLDYFQISTPSSGGSSLYMDEVRIGTTWASVTPPNGPPPPPPSVPSITEVLLVPEGFVLRGTNGTTNGTYYVITTTDISASLSNWFCIATNQFDASGNFDVTNPVSPLDAKRFYRVWYGSPAPVNPVAPSISAQPQSQAVNQGQTANFSVVASGTAPLSYQWYYNSSTPVSGATGASLTLNNVQPGDAGGYSVVVANSAGSVTSSVATLTVNIPVAPSISTQPQDQTVGEGDTASFSVVASGSAPLIYQWYFNSTTPVGSGTATLTLSNVSTSAAGGYSVEVDNSYGSITSVVATLTVTNIVAPPSITTQPEDQTVTAGQGVVFSVTASGTPPLSYQWYFNTNSPLANATNSTLGLSSVSSNDAGAYSVLVANNYGSISSAIATLTVNPAPTNGGPVQIIQAEDGAFTGTVANNHSGYTGSGFVDTENAVGSYIEVEFGRQQAGTETMYVRYAHGKTDSRPASVMVNGATVTSSLAFPATSGYTDWEYVTNTIPVTVGKNILRLTALNSGGLVNVDRIEITGDPQYKVSVSVIGRGIVSLNPSNEFNYYNPGTLVELTGVALTGAVFAAWSGDLVSSNNPETLVVNSNKSVTATFDAFLHFPIYVSPTGNDSNLGTIDQPFYSLQKGVDAAIPGDTIYVRGGTFTYSATVTIAKPGTSNAPITIVAYTGEHPVLDYSTWVPANEDIRSGARGIHITTNAQYWVLKGLEIQYAPDNGVKCEGGHITFEQCIFHHNGDGGLQIGLNKDTFSTNPNPDYWAAYNTVINCDAYRNADPATSYENADGFSCKLYAGKGNYYYGCRAWENCDDGWDCYQTEYAIVIENCWTWHNGDPSLWGFSSFNGDGNGFKLGGDNTYCPITMRNCIALNCQWGTTVGYAFNNNTAPFTFYNCTALNCGRPYKLDQAGNILKNCVDYNGTRPAPVDISSSSTMQNNSWNLPVTVTAADFVSISETDAVAPRQADGSLPNNGFGRLVAGSDLIDKGVDVGLPYCGTAPDLGAYEYCP